MNWATALTTVPKRRTTLLPRTLASLKAAGFGDGLRLFVDGDNDPQSWEREFGLEVTCRFPRVRAYGNWVLALAELYARDAHADRYAVFQDDFTTYRNLRAYLEAAPYPERGYWNLYTFPENQRLAPADNGKQRVGWYPSNQLGKGALALIFDRNAVVMLLTHHNIVTRIQNGCYGWRKIDGGVVEAARKAGWTEYVHNPSLVQHTGIVSTMDKRAKADGIEHTEYRWQPNHLATSFRGESFDALKLLGSLPDRQETTPEREERVRAWHREMEEVRRALREDEARFAATTDRRQRLRLHRAMRDYQRRLKSLEKSVPPSVTQP